MKRLLVCNFFPAFFPPTSGGEQRYHLLYRELSARFDVTLLSPTYADAAEEIVEFSPTFREHRIPKDARVYGLHAELAANDVGPECSAIVMGIAAGFDWAYGRAVARYAAEADAVIHECPFTYGYDRSASCDGKPRFYNSYNVETVLMGQMLGGPMRAALLALCEDLERALVRDACRVFATSREEREEFARRFARPLRDIGLVPNGFDGAGAAPVLERNGPVLFMGSRHPPNVEAARFIVESLAPALPDVQFEIIGSVCRDLGGVTTSNVVLSGLVTEEEKRDRLARCRVALNPMAGGAGTNLKMLDYLAGGAPVLTTRVGARGLDLADGVHAHVVDEPGEFAAALPRLLAAEDRRARLGAAARQLAYSSYTWSAIAKHYGDELERAAAARCTEPAPIAARRTVLVINDFPVATPRAGGEIRINRLYSELSVTDDVVLLCLCDGDSPEETWITPGFLEMRIPKTPEHRAYERVRNQGSAVSASDIFASDFCVENSAFGAAFDRLSAEADVVVLEHPYLAPMARRLPAAVPVVYSALNVESSLKRAMLAPRVDATELVRRTAELERYSVERAALIVCVTESDRCEFERTWPAANYAVVPNGVETRDYEARNVLPPVGAVTQGRPLAVFVGSAHPPNLEAARFVIEQLAPAVSQCVFAIIGSCCHALGGGSTPSNVLLLGILDESVKNRLLICADFAVNPMFGGGGSSLKVAEYFAAGLPTVTTPIGARGFPIVDGVHALLAEPPAFAAALLRLVVEPGLAFRLATAARHFARRELDWTVLAGRLRRALDGIASPRGKRPPKRPRLLVVTYRYTDTPQGGAELYLKAMLAELAKLDRFDIDLCATDADRIWDHCHFATRVSRSRFEPRPEWATVLRRFPVDARDERRLEASCRTLFAKTQVEDVALARRFIDALDGPMLLGGWYAPEGDRGERRRWTGPLAEIFLAEIGETTLRLDAQVLAPAIIKISCDGSPLLVDRLEGRRLLECRIPPGRILAIESDSPATVEGDARLLGVYVRAIELAGMPDLPLLETDYAAVARTRDPQRWISALIDMAKARDSSADLAFLEARGPNSRALEAWVRDHVADYDAVLVQGVPFATLPRTITAARAKHVPSIALPHFHVEDPYYHWRAYYDAFVAADAVIASPPSLVSTFFDRIGARGIALPGGGADPAEFESREPKVAAFRAVVGTGSPFVLVLGRKAGGKHYRKVFDSVRLLREQGLDLEIVMIGQDEDQAPITDPFVRYIGPQPREVIVGALASSVCLASMSESESFGIVIVESWLAGRPVVASRACTAFAELVTHGVNGLLVANEHELAAGIAAYLEDDSAAAAAGAAGRLIAQRDYTWAGIARKVDELLTAVMPLRPPRASLEHQPG